MTSLRCSSFLVIAALTACSSSTTPSSTSGGTSGTATSGGTSGTAASGCAVTFGGDAASVKATSCNQLGPIASDSTVLSFNGDATGLDSPLFVFSVKFPNPLAVKTYQTADLFYVSDNMTVTSTGKNYAVDFDSTDATKTREGSVTAAFTSAEHGTIDITLDTSDTPARHATAHITF